MCGRFTLHSSVHTIADRFGLTALSLGSISPRYNIAPTDNCLILTSNDQGIRSELMEWGFVGTSANKNNSFRIINSRADKLMNIPRFLGSLQSRRCLVVADGFYEWERNASALGPMYYHLQDNSPFAFAGIWTQGLSPSGIKVKRFSIITTDANTLVGQVHHRMPVILSEESETAWLDQSKRSSLSFLSMLIPFPSGSMQSHRVSRYVNRSGNDEKTAIEPIVNLL